MSDKFQQLIAWCNDISEDMLRDCAANGVNFDEDTACVDCECADEDFLPGMWRYSNDSGTYRFKLVANFSKRRNESILQYQIEKIEN